MSLTEVELSYQNELKTALQENVNAKKLENLAAGLIGKLLGIPIAVAKSGFQHGGDGGAAGQQGRRFRLECKKYGDDTRLDNRELLGEIDQALGRDEALEAWFLIATRSVPEQLAQDLQNKSEQIGVPIVVIDWREYELAPLAALCAFDPNLVEAEFSEHAASQARALQSSANDAISILQRTLQAWCLGFETLRLKSHQRLEEIWTVPLVSNANLGQDAAGGGQPKRIRRQTVHDALDAWWRGAAQNDSPAAIVGWDGVGKTWATLDWLTDRKAGQPIILTCPSSALAGLVSTSELGVKRILAERLYDLTSIRTQEHWLRRLEYLLTRPAEEGPVLTMFFDGLNQEPTVPWLLLLKTLQGPAFAGRVRVMLSTRFHHFTDKLSRLRSVVVSAEQIKVDLYDITVGGEFDAMLAFEKLSRADLHPELIELARTPRLFKLVIRFRDHLVEADKVTVHRLLWEYGRDTLGVRSERSFSEADWRAWLIEISNRYRKGIREYSLKSLSEMTSRPDLQEREVYARLSDIIDGRFTLPGSGVSGSMQLSPTVVAHALGAALLVHLDSSDAETFEVIETKVVQWLDPIAGLDQRAEILRAAVSIIVEIGGASASFVGGVLVTSWLQTQNITDGHRRELASLAANIPDALLDAVEKSDTRTQASARQWAVNALRAIPREEGVPLTAIVKRVCAWLSIISRQVDNRPEADENLEKRRAERYCERVGVDRSGPLSALGVKLQFVDFHDGSLQAAAPSVLEGFPIVKVLPCFEALVVAMAINGHSEAWRGMEWICYLNEIDPEPTAAALRTLSEEIRARSPEAGIHPLLSSRAAALLLYLCGHLVDEERAAEIDHRFDYQFTYEKDYLTDPGRSFFSLERRHADAVLSDTELPLQQRIQRTIKLWLDPTFQAPSSFVDELRISAVDVDVENLHRKMGPTQQDHAFENLELVLARCAPELLADLIKRKLKAFSSCPPESRYWSAVHAAEHFILADEEEAVAAKSLRLSAREKDENYESFAAADLLRVELRFLKDALSQFEAVIAAGLKFIPVDFVEIIHKPTFEEVDILVSRYAETNDTKQADLIVLFSIFPVSLSEKAWSWLSSLAGQSDHKERHVIFRMLTLADAARFGRTLMAINWTWKKSEHFWINHYGSEALIKSETSLPFDQLIGRIAPWCLLKAARVRGCDPSEVLLAVEIFSLVLAANNLVELDLGARITVEQEYRNFAPMYYAVEPKLDVQGGDPAAQSRPLDGDEFDKAHRRAVETVRNRVEDAQSGGASLYLADIGIDDAEMVVRCAPEVLSQWLEGVDENSTAFCRRIRLAEPTFMALCEVLLAYKPERGVALWRALIRIIETNYVGAAGISELLHILFRVPESPMVIALRDELISLPFCHTDQKLFEIAVAAAYNGKADWITATATADQGSALVWRQRRGILLSGMGVGYLLPVTDAWPENQVRTSFSELQLQSARLRWREACASHWWHAYLDANDSVAAYASWILFLRSADARAWICIRESEQAQCIQDDIRAEKLSHMHLNRAELKSAMKEKLKDYDDNFLDQKTVDDISPWRKIA